MHVGFVISRFFNLRIDSRHPYTTILRSDKLDTAILHSNFMFGESRHSNQLISAIKGRNKNGKCFDATHPMHTMGNYLGVEGHRDDDVRCEI